MKRNRYSRSIIHALRSHTHNRAFVRVIQIYFSVITRYYEYWSQIVIPVDTLRYPYSHSADPREKIVILLIFPELYYYEYNNVTLRIVYTA